MLAEGGVEGAGEVVEGAGEGVEAAAPIWHIDLQKRSKQASLLGMALTQP